MQKSPKNTLGGTSEVFFWFIYFFANTNLRIGEWMGGLGNSRESSVDSQTVSAGSGLIDNIPNGPHTTPTYMPGVQRERLIIMQRT